MANNVVTALNTAVENGAQDSVAANASAANVTANVANAQAAATPAAAPAPPWIADFCDAYGDRLLQLAVAFLLVALLLGVASSIIALKKQADATPTEGDQVRKLALPDPKFIEALKGLIDALAKAPAWFALFLGGALLLWMAGSLADDVCKPGGPDSNANRSSTAAPGRTAGAPGGNTTATANSTQPADGNSSGTKSGR